MALTYLDNFGATYHFAFNDVAAPISDAVIFHTVTVNSEPEVNVEAKNNEGVTFARAVSVAAYRKHTISAVGYLKEGSTAKDIDKITFDGRTFKVTSVSEPRNRGEFVEVTVEGVAYGGVSVT